MKILFLALFLSFAMHAASAAKVPASNGAAVSTKLLCGKVIDKATGEEIAGAEIKIGDETIYSDFNGNFFAVVRANTMQALVKFISYSDTKIALDIFSYHPLVIELEN